MLIRPEEKKDAPAIHHINTACFPTPAEANLVDQLRQQAHPFISLVAEITTPNPNSPITPIVGHIAFSPVTLPDHSKLKIMGLAPMAVSPSHQNRGIGAQLIRTGLKECRKIDIGAIVVLGHPSYYPRFGFTPTAPYNITSEYAAPPEAFMLLELKPHYLQNATGTIKYHPAFQNL